MSDKFDHPWRPGWVDDFRELCNDIVAEAVYKNPAGMPEKVFEKSGGQTTLIPLDDLLGVDNRAYTNLKQHERLQAGSSVSKNLNKIIRFLAFCCGREDISEFEQDISTRVPREDRLAAESVGDPLKTDLKHVILFVLGDPFYRKTSQDYYEEAVAYREAARTARLPPSRNKLPVISEANRILKIPAHTGKVNRISFRPNGREFATSSVSRDVKIWPIFDAVGSYSINKQGDHILGCEHSLDGRYLATASRDHIARIWDLDDISGKPKELHGHSARVTDVAFCPTRRVIATSSDDLTVRVWDLDTDEDPRVLEQHDGWVRSVCFSACGELLVSSSADCTAIVWDWSNAEVKCKCVGHADFVYEAAFLNNSREVVTGSMDGTVKFWDSITGAEFQFDDVGPHLKGVTSLSVTTDGSLLATGSLDGSVILWDAPSRQPTERLLHRDRSINAVRLSPDGKFLVTGTLDRDHLPAGPESYGEVSLWQLSKKAALG